MDINYYLLREQIERVRADRAATAKVRAVHRQMAEGYRELVEGHRRNRLDAAGLRPRLRPPVL